jgi:DNA-binding MarR family transcriptional regulator
MLSDQNEVARVRSFNRAVAERIGALRNEHLGRARPLGQSRVLWELSDRPVTVAGLRSRLSLDAGYLSRILRSLIDAGLAEMEPDPEDRRGRLVVLTDRGARERSALDESSDTLARSLLAPLDGQQRLRLVEAMAVVEQLLAASLVEPAADDPAEPGVRCASGRS